MKNDHLSDPTERLEINKQQQPSRLRVFKHVSQRSTRHHWGSTTNQTNPPISCELTQNRGLFVSSDFLSQNVWSIKSEWDKTNVITVRLHSWAAVEKLNWRQKHDLTFSSEHEVMKNYFISLTCPVECVRFISSGLILQQNDQRVSITEQFCSWELDPSQTGEMRHLLLRHLERLNMFSELLTHEDY